MNLLAALQWHSPQWLALTLLMAAGAGFLVALLYWPQVRQLSTKWRIALPALRWLAIAAMVLALAKPVAQRPLRETEQGAVVILMDQSPSMGVRDGQRTPAMLVALADGLGLLPAGTRARAEVFATVAPEIDRLRSLVDAIAQSQVELDVAQLQGKGNPAAQKRFDEAVTEFSRVTRSLSQARQKLKTKAPRLAEALAGLDRLPPVQSRQWSQVVGAAVSEIITRSQQFQTESDDALYRTSPPVRQVCDDLSQRTRLELVEDALTRPQTGLLSRLPVLAPMFGYAIGSEPQPVALRGPGNQPVKRLLLKTRGSGSDLTGGLREVLDQLRYQPIQAVLLFSDGRQVGAEPSIASSLLGGSSAPVFAISPAPPGGAVRDLSIVRITAPTSLFVGEVMTVTAELRWTAPKYRPPQAILEVDGRQFTAPVEPRGTGPLSGTASFSVAMNRAGPQRITVSVASVEGEITPENNRAQRYVKVLADKFDVLLAGGSPSWDLRYLRNALSRTSWISSRTVLMDAENAVLKLAPEHLASRDVVILADLPVKALSAEQWEAVRKMVAQRGGSVILIAGRAFLPRQYTTDAVADFLPWKRPTARGSAAVWRQWPGEEPAFRVVPAPGSALAQAMTFSDQPTESAQRWLDLPPVFRYLAMPQLKESVESVLVERETGAPILTRHRLGRGNVFFLGLDQTWRWRYRVGERDQDRFFQQLIRLAADEPYAATNDSLSLDAERVVVAPREPVRVRARLNEPPMDEHYPAALPLEILRDQAAVRTQSLARVGQEDSGRYEGSVEGLDEGEYRLRLRNTDGAEIEYPLHVAANHEAEMSNLTPDEDLLRRLAVASGGDFRTLDQLGDLPQRLERLRRQHMGTAQVPLWNSWYLYGFVTGCLGLEWALRKRMGLA